MNKKNQLQFIHQCVLLLEAGISLSEVLSIITSLEKSPRKIQVLEELRKQVESGSSLSRSIGNLKISFDPALLSLISLGESSGILTLTLRQALAMSERGNSIKKKLTGALVYPAFIAAATVLMTLFLVMYIFPKIIPLFSSMNITLPLLTRTVRGLYILLVSYGLWMLGFGFVAFTIFALLYKKKRKVKFQTQLSLLRSPILGIVLQKYFIATDSRSIATLLECGQTLPVIIGQVAEASTLEPYKNSWREIQDTVMRGGQISAILHSKSHIFPKIVPNLLSIGERTGSLTSMFQHVSAIYEEELDNFVRKLGTSIEPVLMIAMGLIVGSVALSIILPIYEITNHLTQ